MPSRQAASSFSPAAREPAASSMLASHSAPASLIAWSHHSTAMSFLTVSARRARRCLLARFNPKPNSALSSNRELAHAGPCPLAFLVYGQVGALPP